MRALICHDDGQLRRVESAIAAIESAQPCYRQGKQALLEALQIERASLLQYTKRRHGKIGHVPVAKHLRWLDASPVHAATAV